MSSTTSYLPVPTAYHRDSPSSASPPSSQPSCSTSTASTTTATPATTSSKPSDRRLSLASVISVIILTFVLFSPTRHSLQSAASSAVAGPTGSLLAAPRAPGAPPAAVAAAAGASDGGRLRFCEEAPCVFDVGHNTGQDTYDYLQNGAANLRVVAVDANPLLIDESRKRFKDAVRSSRLQLVNAGLVKNRVLAPTADKQQRHAQLQATQRDPRDLSGGGENLTFWVNEKQNKFSSFDEQLGCRNMYDKPTERGSPERACHKVQIPTTTCANLLRQFGTPVYLKVDIEGLDMVCLDTLFELPLSLRPKYVSIENVWPELVYDLVDMGYTRFKVVDQYNVSLGRPKELIGGSGPWGDDAVDCQRGYYWSTAHELINRIPSLPKSTKNSEGKDQKLWYDLHGRRETE